MARVNGIFNITGSLQNVSFYTIKGSDKVYMRTKGGPSKRRVKKGPEFEKLRKHQVEWKGCVTFSQGICNRARRIYQMRDFNVAPQMNGIAKKLMKVDKQNEIGARTVMLSQCKEILEGFNFNRRFPFNQIFRTPFLMEIDKDHGTMKVSMSRIVTKNDLYNVQKLPYFRLVFNLMCVTDVEINSDEYRPYWMTTENDFWHSAEVISPWFSSNTVVPEQSFEIKMIPNVPDNLMYKATFLGSIGIEFGTSGDNSEIQPVEHACCSKIVKAV